MSFELRFQVPGQLARTVVLDQPRMMVGTLLSNHVVLRAPGVDPIHALFEEVDGAWMITDVGSETGVKVNNVLIDVEAKVRPGDKIAFGSIIVEFAEQSRMEPPAFPPPRLQVSDGFANPDVGGVVPPQADVYKSKGTSEFSKSVPGDESPRSGHSIPDVQESEAPIKVSPSKPLTVGKSTSAGSQSSDKQAQNEERRAQKNLLFSPRDARPSGDILEVVAYWEDTVLDVDLFHPAFKEFNKVTIGVTPHAHFIAAGEDHFSTHTLARFSSSGGFKLNLLPGMETRMRRSGKVEKVSGQGQVSMDRRDIAHIKFGPVRYFLLFVRPPEMDFKSSGPKDPVLMWFSLMALVFYFIVTPALWMSNPPKDKSDDQEIYAYVEQPQEQKKPEPEKKKEEVKKPEVKVEEKKEPPKNTPKPPTPPKPQPVKPAKPIEKEKVEQPKPVEKPAEKPAEKPKMTQALQQAPTPQKPSDGKPGPTDKPKDKAPGDPGKLNKLTNAASAGMESTGAKKPDFKYAGAQTNKPLGAAGGPKGAGNNQTGGAIKGKENFSVQGVEGVNNNKASGVNLDKLAIGVGKVLNKTGPGAIPTNFQTSGGGLGGGAGSASKTYGMGGAGAGKSLGLAGAGGAAQTFGNGSGGDGSGQGGTGGFGGRGGGPGFGKGGPGGNGQGGGGAGGHGRADITIPPGDPGVTSGLSAQEVMAVIRAHLNEIRHCYEQLLQRSPSASGKIAVEFVIALSGNVSSVKVTEASLNDSVMRGCVTGKISRWDFPSPRGGQPVTVNYPFVFNPQ
jgi:pSer/pThr/pTyr-binding forkhead associated (FHA) protein